MPAIPSLSQVDLWRNVLDALKAHDTDTPIYIGAKGKKETEKSKQANIRQLAKLALMQPEMRDFDPKKTPLFLRSLTTHVSHHNSSYLTIFFKYLTDSAFIGTSFNPKTKFILGYSQWLTLKCGQDVFIQIMKTLKKLEAQVHQLSEAASPEICNYFLTTDDGVHKETLAFLFSLRPKTLLGERLYKKLIASAKEPAITFSEELPKGEEKLLYSIAKVIAFSTPEFITKLASVYLEDKAALDEIHLFSSKLKEFFTLFFLRQQLRTLTLAVAPHIGHYKVTLLKPLESGTPQENFLVRSEFSSLHPFSIKMFDQIDEWERVQKIQALSPTYNDYLCTPETDLIPFESLFTSFETEEKQGFHEGMDTFSEMVTQVRHELLTQAHDEKTSKIMQSVKEFEPSITRYLQYSPITINPLLPNSKAAWLKEMTSIKVQLEKIGSHEFLQTSKSFQKAFLDELRKERAHVSLAGGGSASSGISLIIKELDGTSSLSAESEIEELEGFFEKKPVKIAELKDLIGQRPLNFSYAERVTMWFDDVALALSQDEYRDLPASVQDYKVKIHAFSWMIDEFVNSDYSFKKDWIQTATGKVNDLYLIPGILVFQGRELKGMFEYCIDSETSVCYHRVFRSIKEEERLSDFFNKKKVDFEADFPTLGSAVTHTKTKFTDSESSITYEFESIGRVAFFDPVSKDRIILYKI